MEVIFTYGTLQIPEVMAAVTGRRFPSCQGHAHDFSCYLLKDRIYPGMTPTLNQVTPGRLYFEVDSHSLWLLDQFEDPLYRREIIPVDLPSKDFRLSAQAYVIPSENQDRLSHQLWQHQDFIQRHLSSYLTFCRDFLQQKNGRKSP